MLLLELQGVSIVNDLAYAGCAMWWDSLSDFSECALCSGLTCILLTC